MTKTCSRCGLELPATLEHFHSQAKGKYGVTSRCKKCKNEEIELWRQNNTEKHRAYKIKWREENREMYLHVKRKDSHRRKAWKKDTSYSLDEWNSLKEKFENKCLACGSSGIALTVDHVLPLSLGGTNSIENIQPLCLICNSRKNNKHIDYRDSPTFW